MNQTNASVTLGFALLLIGSSTSIETLFKIFKCLVKLVPILEVIGDDLIYSNELLANVLFYLSQVSINCLF